MGWLYSDTGDRSNFDGNNRSLNNDNGFLFGIIPATRIIFMELYPKIYNLSNLILAFKKARKGKTKRDYIVDFEKNLIKNLLELQKELKNETYKPKPLKTFILRDPKTRKISKSAFRDRIIHHALIQIIEPIFDKTFIYDSCANRKGRGNLFAIKRFDYFKRKITKNWSRSAYCLKADIKHYFQEVNHDILTDILKRKIKDSKVIELILKITENHEQDNKGMPLGNLTSQFFANVYLNDLDYFVKHKLKAKYYIRYVDDFVILHNSKEQLDLWKEQINNFLREELKLELHPEKSKIILLLRGIDFVGFRIFYYYKLLRKRNIRKIKVKIEQYEKGIINMEQLLESYQGWQAYARWANTHKLRNEILNKI